MTVGLLTVAGAYLLGGIPFGFIFYRLGRGGDIRDEGSGNIGATNMIRSAGWRLGILTLLMDGAKGALAVYAGMTLTQSASWGAAAGMAAVTGHCLPVFLAFRGGKGVATACGAFLMIHPSGMLAAVGIFALALGLTRLVAAGSIAASVSFPVAAAVLGAPRPVVLWSAAVGLLIIVRHQENIRRMLRGREPRMFGRDGGERSP